MMQTNSESQFHYQILELLDLILRPEEITMTNPPWIPELQGLKINP